MPDQRHAQMRRAALAERRRKRIVIASAVVGALAAIVALGALIVGTFPTPEAPPSATVATTAVSATRSTPTASTKPRPSAAKPAAKKAAKPAATKKPAAQPVAPPAPPAPPMGMSHTLPGSTQMIVATGAKVGSTTGTLRIFNLRSGKWVQVFSAPCRFGTNGLIDGTQRTEGSRTTPTGIWQAGEFVWGWHATPPPGTTMPYRQTTQNIWWSDEPGSTYNTWVDSSQHISGEHLVDVKIQYEYAYSTGYNSPPNEVVQGRGTAIFLHVFDPPTYHNGLSAGCVAVSRANMVKVFRVLEPQRHPSFAVGTEAPGPTAIVGY
jgi:L,D-peptidoglycan transpeptidase YkuD (ErfK/YbiS/YcfS/YnhG family)